MMTDRLATPRTNQWLDPLHRSGSYPEVRAHARVSALVLTEARDMLSSRPREAQR